MDLFIYSYTAFFISLKAGGAKSVSSVGVLPLIVVRSIFLCLSACCCLQPPWGDVFLLRLNVRPPVLSSCLTPLLVVPVREAVGLSKDGVPDLCREVAFCTFAISSPAFAALALSSDVALVAAVAALASLSPCTRLSSAHFVC